MRKGIRGLESFPGFRWEYYTARTGKRPKRFFVKLPKENTRGRSFPFYQVVLEYGLWRELKPAAKALYPVMRCLSNFDLELYLDIESDEDRCHLDFDEIFQNRKYDFCDTEYKILAEHAGIHRNSIDSALSDLTRNFLIDRNSE